METRGAIGSGGTADGSSASPHAIARLAQRAATAKRKPDPFHPPQFHRPRSAIGLPLRDGYLHDAFVHVIILQPQRLAANGVKVVTENVIGKFEDVLVRQMALQCCESGVRNSAALEDQPVYPSEHGSLLR